MNFFCLLILKSLCNKKYINHQWNNVVDTLSLKEITFRLESMDYLRSQKLHLKRLEKILRVVLHNV